MKYQRGQGCTERALDSAEGLSQVLSTDQHMHVRKLSRAGKRTRNTCLECSRYSKKTNVAVVTEERIVREETREFGVQEDSSGRDM